MIFVAVVLFGSYQSAANVRKNMRMSVTLPYRFLNQPEVMSIINRYKKINRLVFLIYLAATLPVFKIPYTSLLLLYMFLWIAFIFILNGSLYNRYNAELVLLKSKNRWFPEEDRYHVLTKEDDAKRSKADILLRRWFPTTRDKLVSQAKEPIYVDEDECWMNGYYYNPEDKRTTVEKRVGAGTTVNLATKRGRIGSIAAFVFIALVICPILILFFRMDFMEFQMEIGENKIIIDAPAYDYEFEIGDIKEVSLTDTLPDKGIRTNGAATDTYLLGNFRLDEFGSAKVYLYRDYPPYIIIKTEDKTVLFNTKSPEKTKEYYENLVKLTEIRE
jgi:hypothetical protein